MTAGAGIRSAEQVRSLVTPARLAEFFAPRSLALVGASETSGWARFIVAASSATGFTGPMTPVHPRIDAAFGRPAVRTLRDLAEPPDLAFILAPTEAVPAVLDDAAASGVRNAIVLASGYREVGAAGRELEEQLVARAAAAGILVLGPNCLGFLNTHAHAGPFALGVPLPLQPGPVGIALQSGALATAVLGYARARAIGVSSLTSVGNEAMITIEDMLGYLADDESTRVICLFLEEITDPAGLADAAARADAAGKPIVALKVGSSPAGQQAALAHTGSVAGDDAVVDSVLRQLNIIRVTSIEELLSTGALLGYDRWPKGRRMGVLTASGGACDIIADRASDQGIVIPPFAEQTEAAISPLLPSFASAHNPLDVTGYGLANQRTGTLTTIDRALAAAIQDPGLDFVTFSGVNVPEARPAEERLALVIEERLAWLSEQIASSPIPIIPMSATGIDVSPFAREMLGRHGIHVLPGMDQGLRALGNALRWLERRGSVRATLPVPGSPVPGLAVPGLAADGQAEPRTWAETDGRALLERAGVPVVPGELVTSAQAAADAAGRLGLPAALKIVSAQLAHKSDIGGVALGLGTPQQVADAYDRVRAAGEAVAGAVIDGVLVSPMRSGGVELLAGVTVDATFGPVLAVGLGGIWVEVLADTSLRVLPVDAAEVRRMLGELRGLPLLRGARGGKAADLDLLSEVIAGIGAAALSLGSSLQALEVNPLWVSGDQAQALDVLVVTRS